MDKKTAIALTEAISPLTSRVRRDITWIKTPKKRIICVRDESLTTKRLIEHFMGGNARGVCPMEPGDTTCSAILDLDDHGGEMSWKEMAEVAMHITKQFARYGLFATPWRSSGGSGVHLYFLWKNPQDAESVRRRMFYLLEKIGYSSGTKGVAENQIEIFPKQSIVPKDGCGSQFILPGSGFSVPLDPLDGMHPMPLEEALHLQWRLSRPVPVLPPEAPRKKSPTPSPAMDEIKTLLVFIDPDEDHDIWIRVGMAIAHATENSTEGFELYHRWSRGDFSKNAPPPTKYKGEAEVRSKWKSFNHQHEHPVTIATLRSLAMQNGWCECTADEEFGGHSMVRITVKGGGLANEAAQAEAALIDAGARVYQRNGFLVRPVEDTVEASKGRKTKVTRFVVIDQAYMVNLLCQVIQWRKLAPKGKYKAINPPPDVARILLSRQGDWRFPSVIGIISTPTIRPDGSLLLQEGYDEQTRLYGAGFPPMPSFPTHPTKRECLDALAQLEHLLEEFPFVGEASRSVALSALMTPVVRASFSVAPLHVITAPAPGTGKSYILDIAAAITIGQPCPVMAAGQKEEETEKRLATALMTGQPLISLDNVNGELGGDILCQAAERPLVDVRILGKSERVRIEARSTLFANGNNIHLLDDLTRRAIICSLNSNRERPEFRRFKRNPMQEVLNDRGKYIAAVLTIVLGYIAAGTPNPAPPLASYDGWSNYVRSALIWLGLHDPVETMAKAREDDPVRQTALQVFGALRDYFGFNKYLTAVFIIDTAKQVTAEEELLDGLKEGQLREALTSINERGMLPSSRELGNWFKRHKGRIVGSMRLCGESDDHGHAAKWWIEECG